MVIKTPVDNEFVRFLQDHQSRIQAIPPPWAQVGEDLFQTVCAICIASRDRYSAWNTKLLMSIARNQWGEMQRKELRHAHDNLPVEDTLESTETLPHCSFEKQEQKRRVQIAVCNLPEEYRMVVQERFWKGKTCQQIASETNQKIETVKTRSKRGFDKLRLDRLMQQMFFE